ncbi:MAG: hypothetical protein WCT02_01270 [Candidatus Paceibacterota bacterium]
MKDINPRQPVALLSAYNKDGLDEFAAALVARQWKLLASAGTADYLCQRRIPAEDIGEIVGEPILGHRVVTLSRRIHAALLAGTGDRDQTELARLELPPIGLVYVDLYPLEDEIGQPSRTLSSVREKTDLGGVALLRSAAKGGRLVLHCAAQFPAVLRYLDGEYSQEPHLEVAIALALAGLAEERVTEYCRASMSYLLGEAGAEALQEITRD